MDNIDYSENNTKISDSAYSTSCSHSQSRRSHSSKSTHSGSHSSGSSGYGGKQSTTSGSKDAQPENEEQESKKKKLLQSEISVKEAEVVASVDTCEAPEAEPADTEQQPTAEEKPLLAITQIEHEEKMDISASDQGSVKGELITQHGSPPYHRKAASTASGVIEGFSCVVSMHDGIVMYTTASLTHTLGFPKDMWIGRSFIDFVHPKDHSTFASQITNGLAGPKVVISMRKQAPNPVPESTMACRIRCYRSLTTGFGVKECTVKFMPFMLKLTLKNLNEEEDPKITYLVIQANPFFSAFKVPREVVSSATPFVIRHSASGNLEYIGDESIPYLGYLPQDVQQTNALMLYHDEDLPYLRDVYEKIVKDGTVSNSAAYRMKAQNGDFLKLETEWSSFVNPWSMKLEFIIGKHSIIEGPTNPDVFESPVETTTYRNIHNNNNVATRLRDSMIKVMNEVLTKPANIAKQCLSKRCQDLAVTLESLIADHPKNEEDLRLMNDPDYERDFVMLGGISPHHDYNDSKSSTETLLTYNQLNYTENLQRYFDSHKANYGAYDYFNVGCPNKSNSIGTISPPRTIGTHDPAYYNQLSPCASSKFMKMDEGHYSGFNSASVKTREYHALRLTEQRLIKHNTEMEKELLKMRRELRACSKEDREKASKESKQKKKNHLARCNASFNPTLNSSEPNFLGPTYHQEHSLKRVKPDDEESREVCPSRKTRRCSPVNYGNGSERIHNPNAGIIPSYYAQPMGKTSGMAPNATHFADASSSQRFGMPKPCMMDGPPVLYSPISAIAPASAYLQQYGDSLYPFALATGNYEKACQLVRCPNNPPAEWSQKSRSAERRYEHKYHVMAANSLSRSAEPTVDQSPKPSNNSKVTRTSGDTTDRTDGESSFSSFYSSFFRTDSGSAEDSADPKNKAFATNQSSDSDALESGGRHQPTKKPLRRKMEPPWMEHVCGTPDLFYKYQIVPKSTEEVLTADREILNHLKQSVLVNEQLEQLYMDMLMEGVSAKLNIEEGITSSSSSEEECPDDTTKVKRKRVLSHSKLGMIYEEDAELPSPQCQEEIPEQTQEPSRAQSPPNASDAGSASTSAIILLQACGPLAT